MSDAGLKIADARMPDGLPEIEEIGGFAWTLTVVGALVLAVGLFFVIPVGITTLFADQLDSAVLFWLVEGFLRVAILVGYIFATRPARVVLAHRLPRPRHPAGRGDCVRAHQMGRKAPRTT